MHTHTHAHTHTYTHTHSQKQTRPQTSSYAENLDLALQWHRTDLAKRVLNTSGPRDAGQKLEELKDKFLKVLVDSREEMSFITLFLEAAGHKELIKVTERAERTHQGDGNSRKNSR